MKSTNNGFDKSSFLNLGSLATASLQSFRLGMDINVISFSF